MFGSMAATRSPDVDADVLQKRLQLRDLPPQLGPAHAPLDLVLAPEHERVAIAVARQHVLREIEASVGKEFRAGHAIEIAGVGRGSGIALDTGLVPENFPEGRRIFDRECMQLIVAGDGTAAALTGNVHERRDSHLGDGSLVGLPQRLRHRHRLRAVFAIFGCAVQ